ncbi:MAG: hypothetical protein ACYCO3_02920 [Mycobacteriales bacterium]
MLDPFRGAGALFGAPATQIADALAGPLARYLLATRGLQSHRLAGLWALSLACLAAALVLPVTLWGLTLITGAPAGPLRIRVAALATAVVALPATRAEASLANALSALLLPRPDPRLWRALAVPAGAGRAVTATVAAAIAALLLLVVAVLALARWASLWLLVGLAPIAMGFALLPGPGRLLGTWWRLQLTAVFLPVAQAVLLASYLAMFAGGADPLTAALAGLAVLVLLAKLPAWAAGLALGVETRDFTGRFRGAVLTGRALGRSRRAWEEM